MEELKVSNETKEIAWTLLVEGNGYHNSFVNDFQTETTRGIKPINMLSLHMLVEFQMKETQKLSTRTKMGQTRFLKFKAHISSHRIEEVNIFHLHGETNTEQVLAVGSFNHFYIQTEVRNKRSCHCMP